MRSLSIDSEILVPAWTVSAWSADGSAVRPFAMDRDHATGGRR
ncbi:MAG: hypothetical protein WDA71_08505 [Actinomycetota bacterium]